VVTNLDDLDDPSFVVDRVDDPVGTLANPVALGLAGELLATGRTGSAGEMLDARNDSGAQPARLSRTASLTRSEMERSEAAAFSRSARCTSAGR